MLTREKLIETIKQMPEEKFNSLDSILEEIILKDKIENALIELKNGEVHSSEEVDKIMKGW